MAFKIGQMAYLGIAVSADNNRARQNGLKGNTMRIHSDILTPNDLANATTFVAPDGQVWLDDYINHGSRKRSKAFEVRLRAQKGRDYNGTARRRPNTNTNPQGNEYGATYDEWGIFLANLFAIDPNAICGPYNGLADFDAQTGYSYDAQVTA